MAKPVFIITEQRNGAFRKVTYEVVSEGRRLADKFGTELITITLGNDIEEIAKSLAFYGADKILLFRALLM